MNTIEKIKDLIAMRANLMGLNFDPNEIIEAYDKSTRTTYVMLRSINITEYSVSQDGEEIKHVRSEPIVWIEYPSFQDVPRTVDPEKRVLRYHFPTPKIVIMFKDLIYAIRDSDFAETQL